MLYFFLSASDNSLYSSKIDSQGINSENNSEALSYTFVVFFFVSSFLDFSLSNLLKSSQKLARKNCFDYKERLSNFLISQKYLYKL